MDRTVNSIENKLSKVANEILVDEETADLAKDVFRLLPSFDSESEAVDQLTGSIILKDEPNR